MQPTRLYCDKNGADHLLWRIALTRPQVTIWRPFSVGFDGTWRFSPFTEFACDASPCWQPNITTIRRRQVSVGEAAGILLPIIRQHIVDTWEPDKFHFVYHSSGYDSRVLSGTIRSIYLERGDEWLGRVVFACNKWEAPEFREIMKRQGWKADQFYIHAEATPEGLYFAPYIDLNTCYATLNAPCPIPANLWNYIPAGYQAQTNTFLGQTSCQAYSGYWANEVTESFLLSNSEWCNRSGRWYCYNVMASLPMYFAKITFPFQAVEYQKAVASLSISPAESANGLRKAMADLACPKCTDIPNTAQSDRSHPIADSIREQMARDYRQTWYGRHVHSQFIPPTISEFSPEWGKWSLASLCEFLLSKGVTVRAHD